MPQWGLCWGQSGKVTAKFCHLTCPLRGPKAFLHLSSNKLKFPPGFLPAWWAPASCEGPYLSGPLGLHGWLRAPWSRGVCLRWDVAGSQVEGTRNLSPARRRQILPGFPLGPRAHLQRPGRQVTAPWATCWALLHDLPESSQGPGQPAPLILGLEPMVCSTLQNVLPFLVPKSQVCHFMICLLMWPRSRCHLV